MHILVTLSTCKSGWDRQKVHINIVVDTRMCKPRCQRLTITLPACTHDSLCTCRKQSNWPQCFSGSMSNIIFLSFFKYYINLWRMESGSFPHETSSPTVASPSFLFASGCFPYTLLCLGLFCLRFRCHLQHVIYDWNDVLVNRYTQYEKWNLKL